MEIISGLHNTSVRSYFAYWAWLWPSLSNKDFTNTANAEGIVQAEESYQMNLVALVPSLLGATHVLQLNSLQTISYILRRASFPPSSPTKKSVKIFF